MSHNDIWLPACGNTENIFSVKGRRWLYCWNPYLNRHAYLDVDNDVIITHPKFHPAFAPEFEYLNPGCDKNTASDLESLYF